MAMRFSGCAYCQSVVKMGMGLMRKGERVVILGGELGLCPVLSGQYSVPKPQLQQVPVNPPPGNTCNEFISEPWGSCRCWSG